MICCFLFRQKTAYEMRISEWSSDVCSSDLRCRCRANARSGGRGRAARSCPPRSPRGAGACARSCRVLAQALGQAVDPAGDLLERLVAGQVDVDRGDRDVAGAHGVEVGAGAAVVFGTCRAAPPPVAPARILLLDAGFGAVAVAQACDLETGHLDRKSVV